MRRLALTLAFALVSLVAVDATIARADDGIAWRRTSPRVRLVRGVDEIALVVPRGRARGAQSAALAIAPGGRYRASVDLDVDVAVPRGAFLRVALYARPDGAGRQGRVLDSASASGDGRRDLAFTAPAWARAAKLRVLARPARRTRVTARDATLARDLAPPEVVLRDGE